MVFITRPLLDSLMAIALITVSGAGVVPGFFRHNETTYILNTFFYSLQRRDINIIKQTENIVISIMVYNKLCQYIPLKKEHKLLTALAEVLLQNKLNDRDIFELHIIFHFLLLVESELIDIEGDPLDG